MKTSFLKKILIALTIIIGISKTAYMQNNPKQLYINVLVGSSIDSHEKEKYKYLPEISSEKFHTAQFFKLNNDSIEQRIYFKDGTFEKNIITTKSYKNKYGIIPLRYPGLYRTIQLYIFNEDSVERTIFYNDNTYEKIYVTKKANPELQRSISIKKEIKNRFDSTAFYLIRLFDETKLCGKIIEKNNKEIKLESTTFGIITVPLNRIYYLHKTTPHSLNYNKKRIDDLQNDLRKIIINEDVGNAINPIERKYYNLFSEYPDEEFQSAQFYKTKNGKILLWIYLKDKKILKQQITRNEFSKIRNKISNTKSNNNSKIKKEQNGIIKIDSTSLYKLTLNTDSILRGNIVKPIIKDVYLKNTKTATTAISLNEICEIKELIRFPVAKKCKNYIYLTCTPILLAPVINYERLIIDEEIVDVNFRNGIGSWKFIGSECGYVAISSINFDFGKNSYFIETDVGLYYSYGGELNSYIAPCFNLGYRYQNTYKKGGIIFRTGIGWPELGYFSIGINL